MIWAVGALALVVAVGAIADSSWRIASWAVPSGAERALAAVVAGAGLIVAEALGLGLLGLGTSMPALVVAAVATAVIARLALPVPRVSLRDDLVAWLERVPRGSLAAGALSGAAAAWLAWTWYRPFVGYDGMLQNLLEVNAWIHDGHPGSQHRVLGLAPVEAFPLTNDVALAWLAGLSRTFAVVSVWAVGVGVLLAAALATVLARAGVRPVHRWLAVAAVVTVPHLLAQVNSPKTDVAALAWLATCAALAQAAPRHPRLLALAIIAGGLSIGSKTTTLPLVALVLVVALWRGRPRPLPVVVGTIGATVVGGVWYLRNLVLHGSPLWPFNATPWGDPVPPIYQQAGSTFLEDPVATLEQQFGRWVGVAGGGLALATAALVVGVVWGDRRTRAVVAAGFAALAVWTVTPVTGLDNDNLAGDVLTSTTRYLMPVMVLGAIVLALVAERGGVGAMVARTLLVGVPVANLVAVADEGTPLMAPLLLVAVGAAAVAAVGAGARRRGDRIPAVAAPAAVASCSLAVAALVALAADGWTARHREALRFGGLPIEVMLADDLFEDGDHPVEMTNVAWSDLAGDRLQHPVRLLEGTVSCQRLEELQQDSWLVLGSLSFLGPPDLPLERGCLAGAEPFAADEGLVVFAPRAAS